MRLRYLAAGLALAGGLAVTANTIPAVFAMPPVPAELEGVGQWSPKPLFTSRAVEMRPPRLPDARSEPPLAFSMAPRLAAVQAEAPLPVVEPLVTTWSRKIAPDETLDVILTDAGLPPRERAEIARALGAEYDLRRLRPGHEVTLVSAMNGKPLRVELGVDEGVRVVVQLGQRLATRVVRPDPEVVTLAGAAVVESSIFAALDEAGLPARFAVDLAQMLGGTVDFRRELSGGETVRVLWREARIDGEPISRPELVFAALDLGEALYEIIWPEDGSGRATIFRDGEILRVFAQPVAGARLSSVFGIRKHPVFGNVRMHTGVDFAAARGTPVRSTAPGRISFIGRRSGYGRVVEIAHGPHTVTRYAHLSAVQDGLAEGQRVMAGDVIGRVGTTGTATGPNLHYEVLVDGRPTDPLSDDRLADVIRRESDAAAVSAQLDASRAMLSERLAAGAGPAGFDRL